MTKAQIHNRLVIRRKTGSESASLQIFDYQKKKIEVSDTKIENLVKQLIKKLKTRKLFLGVMESCTGGGLANVITNLAGASEVFKGGIVAYSTEVKIKFGVPEKLIKK